MSKHTPGPWSFQPAEDGYRAPNEFEANDYQITNAQLTCAAIVWDNREEGEANARLIAAAPELLAVLERYLPVMEDLENDLDVWHMATEGRGIATLNDWRHAIVKATGETP